MEKLPINNIMKYEIIYNNLMRRAKFRELNNIFTNLPLEQHHIKPRSMGGSDNANNLVLLTVREHFLAHLLLFKMGYDTQIYSVECFLIDSINSYRKYRFYTISKLRWKKWIRKALAYQRADDYRKKMHTNYILTKGEYLIAQTAYIASQEQYYMTAFNIE